MHKLVGAWRTVMLFQNVLVPYPQGTQGAVFVSSLCYNNAEYIISG